MKIIFRNNVLFTSAMFYNLGSSAHQRWRRMCYKRRLNFDWFVTICLCPNIMRESEMLICGDFFSPLYSFSFVCFLLFAKNLAAVRVLWSSLFFVFCYPPPQLHLLNLLKWYERAKDNGLPMKTLWYDLERIHHKFFFLNIYISN